MGGEHKSLQLQNLLRKATEIERRLCRGGNAQHWLVLAFHCHLLWGSHFIQISEVLQSMLPTELCPPFS